MCIYGITQKISVKIRVNDELACILNLKLIINHFSSRITLRPEKKNYYDLAMCESEMSRFQDGEWKPCK